MTLRVLLPLLLAAALGAQQHPAEIFLKEHVGFSDEEYQEAVRGRPLVKVLDTKLSQEVATFGVTRFEVPLQFVLDRFVRANEYDAGKGILAIGKFSDPPRVKDLAKLTIEPVDLRVLARCKPGDCDIRMDAEAADLFRTTIDWSSDDAERQAESLFKELLVNLLVQYQKGGDVALGRYENTNKPLSVVEQLQGLYENSPYIKRFVPELHNYLRQFPNAQLPEKVDEYFVWSKVSFGLQPLIRLNHVIVLEFKEEGWYEAVLISKQLYASRYFHTGLEIEYLIDDDADPKSPGLYWLLLARGRSDTLDGFFGKLIRSKVRQEARSLVQKTLARLKTQLEAEYGTANRN